MKKKQRDLERKKKNMVEGKEGGGGSKSDGNDKNKEAMATVNERKRTRWKEKKGGGIEKRWQR